jgi:UDP-N-acetylmuramyl tripeptide synthase
VPGRLALAIAPGLVARLTARLSRGVVLVSGTNGKTTTARLLGGILDAAGLATIHNRAGANLLSGIASALVTATTPAGQPQGDIGLFEVDEFTLPAAVNATQPALVILLNLFRDQLDRYGEIDAIAERWRQALGSLPASATVVYNADDPMVAEVGRLYAGRTLVFGLEDAPEARTFEYARTPEGGCTLEHAADARYCYTCGRLYEYSVVMLGHMGHYRCPQCGRHRPHPEVRASGIALRGADGAAFTLALGETTVSLSTVLPGLYNVYNAAAAAAGARALGLDTSTIARGLETTAPAFGRGERVTIEGREVLFLLAKNPAGFNEVLRTVLLADGAPVVLIAINDLIADGRDISWLWDVDFEVLRDRARLIVTTGIRAEDMALRLKYAGVAPERIVLEGDWWSALKRGYQALHAGERLYVLPTYTAMLRLRHLLARKGYVGGFWKQ